MGHYSDVYFGYTTAVADKIERLFRKTIDALPEQVFQTTDWGVYTVDTHSYSAHKRPHPVWQIMSTKRTKWYQSYEPEGQITDMMALMENNPDTYPPEEWFWVEIGESLPQDLNDFQYKGDINESFMSFKVEVIDYGSEPSNSYSYTDFKSREDFEKDMELLPAHSLGTINYTYIEEYIDYHNLENRIEPVDEYFS